MEPPANGLPALEPEPIPSELNPPGEEEQLTYPERYLPHASQHEVMGIDPVRPALQNNGAIVQRYKTTNFVGFTITEDPTNSRVTITAPAVPPSIDNALVATATWDPPSMTGVMSQATTVAVSGAVLGDVVVVSFSIALLPGVILSAYVSAANVVTVTVSNIRPDTVDLGSGTLTVWVLR